MQKKSLFLSVAAVAVGVAGMGAHAALVTSQDFDGAPTDTWNYTISGTGGSVSSVNLTSDFPASSRILTGTSSYQHIPTAVATQASTLTFGSVSVADYSATQVSIRLAAISTTSGNGLDNGDYVRVYIALNGADFSPTADLEVQGNANARWTFAGTGVASATAGTLSAYQTGSGGGTRTTDGYSTLLINIPDNTQSFAMKIVSTANSTGEVWSIDNIAVNGTATAIPEPASLGVVGVGAAGLVARRRR